MTTRCRDSEIIDLWLQSQASTHTQSCYRRDVARLLAHVGKPLAKVTLADLHSFAQSLVEEGLAPISRARTIAATKSLFGFCQRMKWIHVNPAAELPLPRYELRLAERILSEGDVQLLLVAQQRPRDHVLLHLLYTAGVRVSEACRLRWRNLSPRGDAGQITVMGKGGRTRAVALPPELWTALNQLRKSAGNESPVFASKSGQPLDRGRVRAILRRVAERAGVADKTPQISPHWLRHAHASHALDRGAPIHLVQATLGHSSIATTSAYLHARPGDSSARFLVVREQAKPAVSQQPKARQTGTVAQLARRVAADKRRSGNEALPAKKPAQSANSRIPKTAAR
jgi:integrase/recombinase XerD